MVAVEGAGSGQDLAHRGAGDLGPIGASRLPGGCEQS